MKVALTGATGYIGSHVLDELHGHGHDVIALVRDDAGADAVAGRATANVVDLYDASAVARAIGDADAVIHTASPGDATSADLDGAVADAAIDTFDGSGRAFIQISGLWIYGMNLAITEDSPFDAPPFVAWKPAIERRVLNAHSMRGVVITSGTAYGDGGGGIPRMLLNSPRDDDGNLVILGSGRQHWAHVHIADLTAFFRLVLEDASARGRYVLSNGEYSTAREVTAAAAVAVGAPGVVPGSDLEARTRVGDGFAEVLQLDQGTKATKARALGWSPSGPSILDEFRAGTYRSAPDAPGN